MTFVYKIVLTLTTLLFFSQPVFAGMLNPPKEGNFALFDEAKFHLGAHYQISCEAWMDRDLNDLNGNFKEYDFILGEEVRALTIEMESYILHELYFSPSVEFADGKISLVSKFHAGGYMWESFSPSWVEGGGLTVAEKVLFPDSSSGAEIIDFEKIRLKQLYIEVITPVGLFVGGRLPNNMHGLNWALPVFIIPDVYAILTYAKLAETGAESKSFKETKFVGYASINEFNRDYLDRDDLTASGVTFLYKKEKGISGTFSFMNTKGGGSDPIAGIADLYSVILNLNYKSEDLKVHAYFLGIDGVMGDLSEGIAGDLFTQGVRVLNTTVKTVDIVRYKPSDWEPDIIKMDMGFGFGVHATYNMGKFTPEFDLHYCKGPEGWYDGGAALPKELDSNDIDIDRKVGAYLLSEIEGKYVQLFPTPAMTLSGFPPENFSYQNIKLIKAGTSYEINKNLKIYGQVVCAWRENTKYFEEDFWDIFMIWNGTTTVQLITTETGEQQSILAGTFQYNDVTYHQEVDDFMGIEFDTELTWRVHKGFEFSLIAAYLKPGGFFTDILTPKEYGGILMNLDTLEAASEQTVIYGPYLAAPDFELSDAWTVQLKADFKFQ